MKEVTLAYQGVCRRRQAPATAQTGPQLILVLEKPKCFPACILDQMRGDKIRGSVQPCSKPSGSMLDVRAAETELIDLSKH